MPKTESVLPLPTVSRGGTGAGKKEQPLLVSQTGRGAAVKAIHLRAPTTNLPRIFPLNESRANKKWQA